MMDLSSSRNWYLIQLKPNAHQLAERNLNRQGFDTFMPMHEVTSRKSGKFSTSLRPLFPSYMFVCFNQDDAPWQKIRSTMGVSRLVTFGDRPCQVPTELVELLFTQCDGKANSAFASQFAEGADILVTSGPFTDFVATIDQIDEHQRVWVLLDILGQQTRVRLDPEQVHSI